MKHLSIFALATLSAISAGCDADKTETGVGDASGPPAIVEVTEPDEPSVVLESVARIERKMSLWADAPDRLDAGPNAVVLQYENFPGHYEIFDSKLVRDCILAREKEPFDVMFHRYTFASDHVVERAVSLETCPDVTERELATEWIEAELLRARTGSPAQIDPTTNLMGWAGRGFYKVSDAADGRPFDGEWQTFCGEKSGVDCHTAFPRP